VTKRPTRQASLERERKGHGVMVTVKPPPEGTCCSWIDYSLDIVVGTFYYYYYYYFTLIVKIF
jgi:hypothetical protein